MKVPRTKIKRRNYMKINFSVKLKNLKGEEIKGDKGEALTLGDACTNALLFSEKDERIEGKEKVRRFKLAHKIYGTKEPISVEAEDIVVIKDLVARVYTTLVAGQAWQLLESGGKD